MKPAGALVLAAAALAAAAPSASALPDEPDLVVRLPGEPYSGQVAPVFVDAFESPGRLLYRFDAVIANQGGTLDLFRDPGDGGVRQAVWPGGIPVDPEPDELPSGPGVRIEDRSDSGGSFEYAYEKTHEHWHFSSAARYELQPERGPLRASEKVGFCLLDSFAPGGDVDLHFDILDRGDGGETWCGFNRPLEPFVRMGISPGSADRYTAQQQFQWVDITGLEPGPAVVRARANPLLCILESDAANNTTTEAREIPGVRAAATQATTTAGRPVAVTLSGEAVAPEVPARRSAGCNPSSGSRACYAYASDRLDYAIVDPPGHGTVTVAGDRAIYVPAGGFEGDDAFSYSATDARGLTSRSARVRLVVGPAPPAPAAAGPSGQPAAVRARLSDVRPARRRGRWRILLRASAPATLSARLERRATGWRRVRSLRARRIAAGPGALGLGRLRPGRYRVRLILDGAPAATAAFTVRRVRRPRGGGGAGAGLLVLQARVRARASARAAVALRAVLAVRTRLVRLRGLLLLDERGRRLRDGPRAALIA